MPTPSSSGGLERGSSPAALAQLEAGVGDGGKWALRARSSLCPGAPRATLRTSHYVAAEGGWEGSWVGNDADHLMFSEDAQEALPPREVQASRPSDTTAESRGKTQSLTPALRVRSTCQKEGKRVTAAEPGKGDVNARRLSSSDCSEGQ